MDLDCFEDLGSLEFSHRVINSKNDLEEIRALRDLDCNHTSDIVFAQSATYANHTSFLPEDEANLGLFDVGTLPFSNLSIESPIPTIPTCDVSLVGKSSRVMAEDEVSRGLPPSCLTSPTSRVKTLMSPLPPCQPSTVCAKPEPLEVDAKFTSQHIRSSEVNVASSMCAKGEITPLNQAPAQSIGIQIADLKHMVCGQASLKVESRVHTDLITNNCESYAAKSEFQKDVKRLASGTVLAPRTTEEVTADLMRQKIKPTEQAAITSDTALRTPSHKGPNVLTARSSVAEVEENQGEEDHDYGDDEDEKQSMPQCRKITERRRRLNSIAKTHIAQQVQLEIRDSRQQDENLQSTKWLVNQSQTQQIISSPRDYQVELFERAKERNTIAVLDTGSGKTLIAVLLIRHTIEQELEHRAAGKKHRICFFLVDSVPLVYQQHAVLKTNLDHALDMFCGDMGCDLWSKGRWEQHFKNNRVIVCTAEVLYQCLSRSFIAIDQINLLVFDEAHHAKKNHSYAMIIKDFYAQVPLGTPLPKIFGMTASPVDSKTDVKVAAMQLEALLHCEIATVADLDLLKCSSNLAREELHRYAVLQPKSETALYKMMLNWFEKNVMFRKPLMFAFQATKELGAWCADQVWPFCFSEEETRRLTAKTESKYHKKRVAGPLEVLETQKRHIGEARALVQTFDFGQPDYSRGRSKSSNLSSKVLCLVNILRDRYERPTEDKCIVFVNQRYTARMLAILLAQSHVGSKHLRVSTLVGTKSGNAGDARLSFHEQAVALMNFRKGVVNCLIATSVAEEGLDIPDCNLIIRFDLYSTVIQYIQSRGRARHANSRYIHMMEEFNVEHVGIVREVRRNEQLMKQFCSQLPNDRLLTGNDYNIDYFLARDKTQSYIIKETGAKLTYRTSLVVLSNFVDSLQHGPVKFARPEYVVTPHGKQFVCEVILPHAVDDNTHEPPIRRAMGRPASTKQVAKCSSAFEMCKLLRKGKYLNEYLIPKYANQVPAMRNAQLAVDNKKKDIYDMRTKPSMWSILGEPSELYVTILYLDRPEALDRPSQPLALLTRRILPALPSFMLHFGPDQHSFANMLSLTTPLKVSVSELALINLFTLSVFDDVFSKGYEPDPAAMPYFFLPIKPTFLKNPLAEPSPLIHWETVKAVEEDALLGSGRSWKNHVWKDQPDDFFLEKFIVDPWDGSRKFWSVGITHEFKPLDPVPPNTAPRPGPRKNNDNILEYSCSLWAKARARRTFSEDQPVVEAKYISLRRNLLDEFGMAEEGTPKKCYLVMEPLKISPLPAPVVAMAFALPAMIHRIESYLIALEAFGILHLEVRPDLALEAVTKDSDNSGDQGDEQINFQRGMGKNYERLELLGDSFLKMAVSISLFSLHPEGNEFDYHVDRMLLICNKNLRNNALKLKLYEFIRSQAFSRRAWYPQGLTQMKGKVATAPQSHKLGDKSMADVCEAIIGAAYLNNYDSRDMDPAVRAVTEVVCGDNHRMTAWADYYKSYTKPSYQIAIPTQAHLDLAKKVESKHAYHFKYPRLLRSAFTHSSYPFIYERIPSYQRLEFLGDALLDMASVNYLFHNFPGRDPQWLTEHKMAMVSNQFLGALCIVMGFHRHLQVFHASLQSQITEYATDMLEARHQAEEDAVRAGKSRGDCAPDYWTTVQHPPKCLPDVVEAYIGAMFVDSEYDYSLVESFFDKHVLWFFKDMGIYDTFANKHPTTFLTSFLQVNMGCQDWDLSSHAIPSIDGRKPMVTSVIIVHNVVVACATAESSRYAKVAAAKKATMLLGHISLPDFRAKYGCSCKASEEDGADDNGEGKQLDHGTAV